jgi:hypothetical protein
MTKNQPNAQIKSCAVKKNIFAKLNLSEQVNKYNSEAVFG